MKRLFPLVLVAIALSGCGSPTVKLVLTFDTSNPEQQTELLQAVTRVIGRRLSRWEGVIPEKISARQQTGSTLLTFDIKNTEARTTLIEELLKPFSLQIMLKSAEEKGDLYVEEQGWFNFTGITQKHIAWVEAAADEKSKKGIVRLVFTDDGRERLAAVLRQYPRGIIGLFVRDRLMSKMQIEGKELRKEILIENIPNQFLADIFADDVNVGTHVTFALPNP